MACRAHPVATSPARPSNRAHGRALGLLGLCLLGVPAAAGCVAPFDGSNIQIDFASSVQTATRHGRTPLPEQPPQDTHFELYAADVVYQLDNQGQVVVDDGGRPIIDHSFMFKVTEFEIRPVIDRSSPCLIELEDSKFPGLHVTQFEAKVKERTGISDPFAPGLDSQQVTDVLNAIRRVANLPLLEDGLKAVTSHEAFRYPATAPAGQCPPTSADALPDPACHDDASNSQRLRRCRALWAAHAELYEGSDKVFTLPLNGTYLGMVEGMNPLNQGFVGGSAMFVDENLVGHNTYALNWQYDDLDGNGTPDFPASVPARERSTVGYLYMSGAPVQITRGVTTVPLRHPTVPAINADLAIIPNLGHDDVHF